MTFRNGRVYVSAREVSRFADRWPCSGLPTHGIYFEFASNGDLVDVGPNSERYDGPALVALSHDAQAYQSERAFVRAFTPNKHGEYE